MSLTRLGGKASHTTDYMCAETNELEKLLDSKTGDGHLL